MTIKDSLKASLGLHKAQIKDYDEIERNRMFIEHPELFLSFPLPPLLPVKISKEEERRAKEMMETEQAWIETFEPWRNQEV